MKTIGFIDYYLGEWHANNYPGWIKTAAEKLSLPYRVAYAWAERDVSPVDGQTTEGWCQKQGVTMCSSIEEVCQKSDALVILAPSDPDKKLGYAKEVLKFKKNTYIDKTFAPDYAIANKIFDIAKRYGTKFFSSSALRYADELSDVSDGKSVIVTAGGMPFDEYIIHPVEIAIKILGFGAGRVRYEKQLLQSFCSVKYDDGRELTIIQSPALPTYIDIIKQDGTNFAFREVKSDFFANLIADMLRFFETGNASFDIQQTLEVMKLRDAILAAREAPGKWLRI